jgi:tetratricopeptide (TPR) repeat protein
MIGQTISKYRVIEKIGQGGMGVVYKAEDLRLRRHVALKLIAPELTRDPQARSRFLQEAQTISSFEHPNICVVHEVDETPDGRMFMAMTYYAGETLREKIARGPLPLGQALDVAAQVAQGLARAHEQGIVHRDVKPANILVPDRGPVKILDFGIAKLLGAQGLTQEGRTLGTASYMSPEQVLGDAVDHRTDLWSLGVVLFEMLAGAPPFPAEHPQATIYAILHAPPRLPELSAQAPPPVVEVVRRCLAKAPSGRPADAAELAAALERLRSALSGGGSQGMRAMDALAGSTGEREVKLDELMAPTVPELALQAPVRRPLPFVGRERELGRLEELLRGALAGEGRVVFVSGEPGIGKTALVAELVRRASASHPSLIAAGGKCNAQTGIGDPYLPFREILSALTTGAEPDWTEAARPFLHGEGTFQACFRALLEAGPDLIGTFVRGPALLSRATALVADDAAGLARLRALLERREAAPGPQQSDLFEQSTRLLQSLSRERPLLILLEDLHWADAGSISLLFHLSRRLQGSRILVVCTYRPAEVALGSGAERHPLAPVLNELRRELPDLEVDLNAADGREFLAALFALEPNLLGAGFRESLFRQTRGYPLFTLELLEGLRAKGILAQDSKGRWDQRADIAWEELPARVEAVVAERLGRLPEELYRVLATASLEGEDFTAEAVARLQGVSEREMVQTLSGELERRHRLVSAVGVQRVGGRRLSRYRFSHIVFQRYLYGRLAEAERSYLHEELGGILEELYGDRAGEIAPALARHFAEAGVTAKAVEYFGRAGHAASRLSAHVEAIAHYEEALRLLRDPRGLAPGPDRDRVELDILTALAPALNTTQGYASPAVERVCDRALELAREMGGGREFGWVLHGIWSHAFVSGAFEKARDLASRLVQFGEAQDDPALLMQGHYSLGIVSQYLGDFAASRRHSERGWELVQAHGSAASIPFAGQDVGVMLQNSLSWTCWALGCPEQALAWRRGAMARAEEIAHPWSRSMALFYSTWLRQFLRDPARVEEETRQLVESSAGQGDYLAILGRMLNGWARAVLAAGETAGPEERREEVERAVATMRETYDLNAATGARISQAYYLLLRIDACLLHGRLEEAREALEKAFAIVESTGEGFWEPELHRRRGNLAMHAAGIAGEDPEEWYQRALAISRRQGARFHELRAATDLARLWAGQERREEARDLLAAVYDGFTEGFETADLREARALLAELC